MTSWVSGLRWRPGMEWEPGMEFYFDSDDPMIRRCRSHEEVQDIMHHMQREYGDAERRYWDRQAKELEMKKQLRLQREQRQRQLDEEQVRQQAKAREQEEKRQLVASYKQRQAERLAALLEEGSNET